MKPSFRTEMVSLGEMRVSAEVIRNDAQNSWDSPLWKSKAHAGHGGRNLRNLPQW
jgi:hypothetical protein